MAKFLYHLQLYCIAWDSDRYESMTSTFYLHQGVSPTEIGTLTDFFGCKRHSHMQLQTPRPR